MRLVAVDKDKKDLLLIVYDKLVIASCIAAVSAVLIYSYNINNKAFELAQAQSRGYASIASKLRELVLDGSTKARQEIQAAYFNKGERYFSKDEIDAIDSVATEIRGVASLLKKRAKTTSTAAETLAQTMQELMNKFAVPDTLNKKAVEDADAKIVSLQADFIDGYDSEVTQLVSDDFKRFYESFENELPWYYRYPRTIIGVAATVLLGVTIVLFLIV